MLCNKSSNNDNECIFNKLPLCHIKLYLFLYSMVYVIFLWIPFMKHENLIAYIHINSQFIALSWKCTDKQHAVIYWLAT